MNTDNNKFLYQVLGSIFSVIIIIVIALALGSDTNDKHKMTTPVQDNNTHTLAIKTDTKKEAKTKYLSGLVKIDGKTYYYMNGQPQWGIYKIGDNYFFFDKETKQLLNKTNYVQAQDGKWYLVGNNGQVLSGKQDWAGSTYYFDPSTHLRVDNSLKEVNGNYYYFGENGQMLVNGFTHFNNTNQYYGQDGVQYRNRFLNMWGNTYYFDGNGNLYTGKFYENWGHKYYFDGNGVLAKNKTIVIKGIVYHADKDGVLTESTYRMPFDIWYNPKDRSYLEGQQYGWTDYDRGYNDYWHDGWDFGSDPYGYNTPIHSICSGTVYSVSYSSDGRGWHVNIKTDDGHYVTYQEAFNGLGNISVTPGQHVDKGTIIGYLVTSHLHLGISNNEIEGSQWAWNQDAGVWIDPIDTIMNH